MRVSNFPKFATQWNSGATREPNGGDRVRIPSAITTEPLSHYYYYYYYYYYHYYYYYSSCVSVQVDDELSTEALVEVPPSWVERLSVSLAGRYTALMMMVIRLDLVSC